jgi:hypothetical protein
MSHILALGARTEIAFGLMKEDGCASLALKTGNGESWLAQDWKLDGGAEGEPCGAVDLAGGQDLYRANCF